MSTESKAQVKLDAEYSKLKQNHDVLALWRLIKQVHRTQAGKLNTADASLDALTSYYTIKQKENENIVQFKDRLLAAVERIESVDPTKAPPEDEQARKFTKSLDPRKFNRLILECEQNESKYEKTLAGALQQASLEKRLCLRIIECSNCFSCLILRTRLHLCMSNFRYSSLGLFNVVLNHFVMCFEMYVYVFV